MSLQIVVPTHGCVNKCKYCVSRMHDNNYESNFNEFQIMKRLKYALMHNIDTCVISGTGEALQNPEFLINLTYVFEKMGDPIPNIELQTTGVMLMNKCPVGEKPYYNVNTLKELGVNTISLSVSDIFDNQNNLDILGVPDKLKFNLPEICHFIKQHNFNLRLTLMMTSAYDDKTAAQIFSITKYLGADQVTFKKIYRSNIECDQTKWVRENSCKREIRTSIYNWVLENGNSNPTPSGLITYSINGMSVVMDDDCMNRETVSQAKYFILRENGKLYSHWDDEGSLIF